MWMHILFLLLGLFLLVKGSDFFVGSASNVAKKMGVSEFIIGLTLVSIGTTMPEMASSLAAASEGYDGLVVGNIVGGNITNIGLVLGIAVIISAIKTDREVLERDGYIMFASMIVLFLFSLNGIISKLEGLFLIMMYLAYVMFLMKSRERLEEYHFKKFVNYFFRQEYLITIKDSMMKGILKERKVESLSEYKRKIYNSFKEGLVKDGLIIILSLAAVVYGANYLIDEAVWLADTMGVSRNLVGITVIALGTSLPELSVSVSAAKKGFGNITIGNVLGSNISRTLFVIGLASIINPVSVRQTAVFFSIPFMIGAAFVLLIFIRSRGEISKREGILLAAVYVVFIAIVVLKEF